MTYVDTWDGILSGHAPHRKPQSVGLWIQSRRVTSVGHWIQSLTDLGKPHNTPPALVDSLCAVLYPNPNYNIPYNLRHHLTLPELSRVINFGNLQLY